MGVDGNLTDEQLQSFHSQGFLVVDSFCGKEEIDAMMGRMNRLLDNFDCSSASISSTENQKQIADDYLHGSADKNCSSTSIFSTKNEKQLTDDFLCESADKISFFFEDKAFDDKGILKQPKQLSINRVGHALHEIDPMFRKYSHSEKIAGLLTSLGYRRPVIIQSMYIFKQAGIGGEVVPHQDSSFLYTDPPSCTGLWLGLEDATIANGCLWAIPGSHKNGLVRRFIRDDNGVHFDKPSPSYDPRDFVSLEVKAGSLIVLHGELVHQSFANQSLKSRHAYSVHAVETDGCSWAADNWMRKAEPEPLYSF